MKTLTLNKPQPVAPEAKLSFGDSDIQQIAAAAAPTTMSELQSIERTGFTIGNGVPMYHPSGFVMVNHPTRK